MKKIVLGLTLLALLNGCIIKEVHTTEKVTPTATATKTVTSQPQSSYDKDTCDVMYTTYKQCYGLGIQLNSTDMCVDSGVELSTRISAKWGNQELGTALGAICAVACETANQDMAMPSYSDFATNACN